MIVLEPKVEQMAESVPYSMHAGMIHPCAALPVNLLETCRPGQKDSLSRKAARKGYPFFRMN